MASLAPVRQLVVRLAGDSGDGIQLAGACLTADAGAHGLGLATLPEFPAEIRAPAGSPAAVSTVQIRLAGGEVLSAGDSPDVLVARNPAALRRHLPDLPPGSLLVCDRDAFTPRALRRAGYAGDPLTDGSLGAWQVEAAPLTELTLAAVAAEPACAGLTRAERLRCATFLAVGFLAWLVDQPTSATVALLTRRLSSRPDLLAAAVAALRAGGRYAEATEAVAGRPLTPAPLTPAPRRGGTWRTVSGNQALALGLVAAASRAGLPLLLAAYPITPATGVLEEVASVDAAGVRAFQAEDEIAAAGAALGAAYGGALGATVTSGPGMALVAETLGLAVALELPLVVVDVQRSGPSTGLPTRTEQSDLLLAVSGRHGEAPLPVLAARSPADCFDSAVEAARIATTYRTPVVLLSDGNLARGSEPWQVPDSASLPDLRVTHATAPNGPDGTFLPYARDPETLARPWALPGTPGLEHRIGGLEKAHESGAVSADPDNHERMVRLRAAKTERVAAGLPPLTPDDPDGTARLVVVTWGSTYGAAREACELARGAGDAVAHLHLRHLVPFPADLGGLLRAYERVLVPELNLGQLALLLRGRLGIDVVAHGQVSGLPFRVDTLLDLVRRELAALAREPRPRRPAAATGRAVA